MKKVATLNRPRITDGRLKEILIDGINAGADYVMTKRRFYDYIKTTHKVTRSRTSNIYDTYYHAVQAERTAAKLKVNALDSGEAAKRDVASKYERLEIATKIARGEGRKVAGEILIPTDTDRIRALDYLSKIEGDYAATKIAQTDASGNDVKPVDLSKYLTPLQLMELYNDAAGSN